MLLDGRHTKPYYLMRRMKHPKTAKLEFRCSAILREAIERLAKERHGGNVTAALEEAAESYVVKHGAHGKALSAMSTTALAELQHKLLAEFEARSKGKKAS